MKNIALYLTALMGLCGTKGSRGENVYDSDYVITEYALIKQKKSKLSRKNREAIVYYRENNLSNRPDSVCRDDWVTWFNRSRII